MKIEVKVIPKAKKNVVESPPAGEDGVFRVYTTAAPTDGKANLAAIELLAEYFDMPKSAIRIIRGHTGRNKIIEVGRA